MSSSSSLPACHRACLAPPVCRHALHRVRTCVMQRDGKNGSHGCMLCRLQGRHRCPGATSADGADGACCCSAAAAAAVPPGPGRPVLWLTSDLLLLANAAVAMPTSAAAAERAHHFSRVAGRPWRHRGQHLQMCTRRRGQQWTAARPGAPPAGVMLPRRSPPGVAAPAGDTNAELPAALMPPSRPHLRACAGR